MWIKHNPPPSGIPPRTTTAKPSPTTGNQGSKWGKEVPVWTDSPPSPSLPFHPTPHTRPPQPDRRLVNAISKRICDILSPEDAFGDSKTISIYDSRQKEVMVWFEVGQRRSTSMPDQSIQSHFEHWPYPGVTAVTVRRLFVFVTDTQQRRCSTIKYCTIIYNWYATMWNRQLV